MSHLCSLRIVELAAKLTKALRNGKTRPRRVPVIVGGVGLRIITIVVINHPVDGLAGLAPYLEIETVIADWSTADTGVVKMYPVSSSVTIRLVLHVR